MDYELKSNFILIKTCSWKLDQSCRNGSQSTIKNLIIQSDDMINITSKWIKNLAKFLREISKQCQVYQKFHGKKRMSRYSKKVWIYGFKK